MKELKYKLLKQKELCGYLMGEKWVS